MSINFAAEHMQGYNYPNISVLPITLNATLQVVNAPSYTDLEALISRGTIPILVGKLVAGSIIVSYLTALYPFANEIHFSTCSTVFSSSNAGGEERGRVYIIYRKTAEFPEIQLLK